MFEKGETVYYGTAGVCRVSDICHSPFDRNDKRMYYVLEPNNFNNGTIIYAPIDNDKVILRPLMTKDEARKIISSFPSLPLIKIVNEKQRREEYRNTMKDGSPTALAMIIKTIYYRKQNAAKDKKRVSDTDVEFDKVARRGLFGEISCVLNITEAEIDSMIEKAMGA
ncbi:MAG: CarD family transcriptional regulator [Eubacteriales bacterium]